MDLEPTPEQEALRETVRSFLAARAPIAGYVRPTMAAGWARDDVWAGLEDLGAVTLLVPVEHGGLGLGLVDAAIVAEELGRGLYPGPWLEAVLAHRDGPDDAVVLGGADALGAAQALLEVAVQYAKDRHQFGQPIGAFQAVQHLCVDMYETIELARSGVLHAAWAADADAPDRHVAALRLRAFADRLATVGDTTVQVLGGIGYTWEHDAHLWLRRLLRWSAASAPAAARRELGASLL